VRSVDRYKYALDTVLPVSAGWGSAATGRLRSRDCIGLYGAAVRLRISLDALDRFIRLGALHLAFIGTRPVIAWREVEALERILERGRQQRRATGGGKETCGEVSSVPKTLSLRR